MRERMSPEDAAMEPDPFPEPEPERGPDPPSRRITKDGTVPMNNIGPQLIGVSFEYVTPDGVEGICEVEGYKREGICEEDDDKLGEANEEIFYVRLTVSGSKSRKKLSREKLEAMWKCTEYPN